MSKARATTIQQRFGFKDNDLKTATHDQLMIWLDRNIEEVANRVIPNEQWTENDIRWANNRLVDKTIKLVELPERSPLTIRRKTWEFPIMSGKYVIGFIDMYVIYNADQIGLTNEKSGGKYHEWYVNHSEVYDCPFCCEVKSEIPSLGEPIRQIRMYQEYLKGRYVVISPDARFAEAIRAQKIGFYHCQSDEQLKFM